MARESLRLGVVQMTSIDDLDVNLRELAKNHREAAALGAELVVFPENTLYFRIRAADRPREPTPDHLAEIQALVDESNVPLMLSTAREERAGRFANATLLFRPRTQTETVYEKIHLFDIHLADEKPVRESDHFRNGDRARAVEVAGWKIGLTICYDLRFPELYLKYAQDVDLILVPSAFLVETGRAHWHVLLRARAIESQAWVAAPAQVGAHSSGEEQRRTFGHSLVVSPWGEVTVDLGEGPAVRVVELRRGDVNKMREQIPMADHRRPC